MALAEKVSWESLGRINNDVADHVSKLAILLVPLAATAIDLLHRNSDLKIALPVSLLVAYLSALLYFLGVGLFKFSCPYDIRRYGNLRSYVDDLKTRLPEGSLQKSIGATPTDAERTETLTEPEIENLIHVAIDEEMPAVLVEVVSEKWNKDNGSLPALRMMIGALFLIALLLGLYLLLWDAPARVYRAAI